MGIINHLLGTVHSLYMFRFMWLWTYKSIEDIWQWRQGSGQQKQKQLGWRDKLQSARQWSLRVSSGGRGFLITAAWGRLPVTWPSWWWRTLTLVPLAEHFWKIVCVYDLATCGSLSEMKDCKNAKRCYGNNTSWSKKSLYASLLQPCYFTLIIHGSDA